MRFKKLGFFVLFFFSYNMVGSCKKFRPLESLIFSTEVDSKLEKFDSENMNKCREATIRYNFLLRWILKSKLTENLHITPFQELCHAVREYQKEFFEILVHNQLLRERDDSSDQNPFNHELIPHLEKLAEQNEFPLGWVPFKIVLEEKRDSVNVSPQTLDFLMSLPFYDVVSPQSWNLSE